MSMLQPCINLGLDESKFWDMTIAELNRYVKGAEWRIKLQASLDYKLADLIGISSARMMSKEPTFPEIADVYPDLFEKAEPVKEDLTTKSINNFLAQAQAINAARQQQQSGGDDE